MTEDNSDPTAAIPFLGRLSDNAQDVLAGRSAPAVPRDAATVMLLRPARGGTGPQAGRPGMEVYMLRREPSMAFAPGAMVFPGGSVDSRDADEEVAWAGPDAAAWGEILAAPPDLARALVCAAVRETFEESGVLLAGESADSVVADTTSEDWERDRSALLDRSLSLAELLAARRLVLRSDLLRAWARWITPVVEPRRYDARFFAAALPAGQQVRGHPAEADKVAWLRPGDALDAARQGTMSLLPPTATTLAEFAAATGVADIVGRERRVAPIQPVLVSEDGKAWLEVPDNVGYPL